VPEPEVLRRRLCELGAHLRDLVRAARDEGADLTAPVGRTSADTIFGLDLVTDDALRDWFLDHWPRDEPVEVVSEGFERPELIGSGDPVWTCIVDTIDGTRSLMYDKRAGWSLAAVAPRRTRRSRLGEVVAAAMTEVPTTKQWAADQISGTRGGPLVAERHDLVRGGRAPLALRPSPATDLEQGFASFARFFPQAKSLLARFEERLWHELYGDGRHHGLAVFDDQYLATGGQFHELMAGHDRMLGDVRPLAFAELGLPLDLACHPYDCCTALLVEAAGCVLTDPWGAPLDPPLDTTTPVAWVGFANPDLARLVRPALDRALAACFPASTRHGRP
jgi:hypothetical protein